MHGGRALLGSYGHPAFSFIPGDVRDAETVAQALRDIDAVVHLAAIVGDPACARAPELAAAVNDRASAALIAAAKAAGVRRFVFASTCSNYGRMRDTSVAATEEHELRPVSLYAETKVVTEQRVVAASDLDMSGTALRLATLYGPSPRMRFDLTVNQFVKEALLDGRLTVFGEQFWRPYVHVRDAARAIVTVLHAPAAVVSGQTFNVGHSDENYRKQDLVGLIAAHVPALEVQYVSVADDPRDYRVSFDRIRQVLGFSPLTRVPDGIAELVFAVRHGLFGDLDDPFYSNTAAPRRAAAIA
jgi:nucleoside-diphosphate-sugar epimerase